MKPFLHEDFLLDTQVARILYHECARHQPILDFHCHLPPEQVESDHRFGNLTEIWLSGDHYKWRAMRTNGVDEHFITGRASDFEKFSAWARVVPDTLRNPLYHWTHLELGFPFGIKDRLLGPDTAEGIYRECNEQLSGELTTLEILKRHRVKALCTTDDPTDGLQAHRSYRDKWQADPTLPRMFPTWRPDQAMNLADPKAYGAWLSKLEEASGQNVSSLETLLLALRTRHDAFHEVGCRVSDHGLETLYGAAKSRAGAERIFADVRSGKEVTPDEQKEFCAYLLHELALWDHERGWVAQYHLGALRNNNTRLQRLLGADSGFDSIGDFPMAQPVARFLDALDEKGKLGKTILYNLNPRDNELFASMIGNFQDGSVPGKLQFGSAWWFLDQLDGMRKQIDALSALGLLSRFVGMLTDSRSFLSYSRHEYFRRLLCNMLGDDVERGLLPSDQGLLMSLVKNVCFDNARDYFQLDLASENLASENLASPSPAPGSVASPRGT